MGIAGNQAVNIRKPNPLRVWLYRGWCWVCRAGMGEHPLVAHMGGYGYSTPGEAADAARKHLREAHWSAE